MVEDLRWERVDGTGKESYRDTLVAMCTVYGSYAGFWHAAWEWERYRQLAETADEVEAECLVRQIEREKDSRLAEWRMYQ